VTSGVSLGRLLLLHLLHIRSGQVIWAGGLLPVQ
jgi:hypothetical protein